jgi:hypothetical protein
MTDWFGTLTLSKAGLLWAWLNLSEISPVLTLKLASETFKEEELKPSFKAYESGVGDMESLK